MAPKSTIQIVPPTLSVRNSLHSLIGLLVAVLVISVIYLGQNGVKLLGKCSNNNKSKTSGSSDDAAAEGCNLSEGRWVFDNESYPLYGEKQCSFMSDQLACEKFGRKDLSFRNWRWQPHHCDIPRSALATTNIIIILLTSH